VEQTNARMLVWGGQQIEVDKIAASA